MKLPPTPLLAFGALSLGMFAMGRKKSTPPTTTPGGYIPIGNPGGPGGGGGDPVGSPLPGSQPPPHASPAPGVTYRPNQYLQSVRAYAFPGRGAVAACVTGAEMTLKETPGDAPPERHENIMRWLDAGRLDAPTWVRIPVRGGLEVEVTKDVVSMGGVRLCGPEASAQAIADEWNAMLITPGISDAIHAARTLSLAPRPVGWFDERGKWVNPGGAIPWLLYYADRVEEQIQQKYAAASAKGVGHVIAEFMGIFSTLGKDYVLVADQVNKPAQCCIYGLHGTDGVAIQSKESGQSFKHHLAYYDYSHAIRLVRKRCWLNGKEDSLARIYQEQPALVSFKALPSQPIPVRHPRLPPRVKPPTGGA